jgi:hypothetical protein
LYIFFFYSWWWSESVWTYRRIEPNCLIIWHKICLLGGVMFRAQEIYWRTYNVVIDECLTLRHESSLSQGLNHQRMVWIKVHGWTCHEQSRYTKNPTPEFILKEYASQGKIAGWKPIPKVKQSTRRISEWISNPNKVLALNIFFLLLSFWIFRGTDSHLDDQIENLFPNTFIWLV